VRTTVAGYAHRLQTAICDEPGSCGAKGDERQGSAASATPRRQSAVLHPRARSSLCRRGLSRALWGVKKSPLFLAIFTPSPPDVGARLAQALDPHGVPAASKRRQPPFVACDYVRHILPTSSSTPMRGPPPAHPVERRRRAAGRGGGREGGVAGNRPVNFPPSRL
jgi:hypothetical protein